MIKLSLLEVGSIFVTDEKKYIVTYRNEGLICSVNENMYKTVFNTNAFDREVEFLGMGKINFCIELI